VDRFELWDHVLAHQLDRLHHLLVGDLEGVDEAQQQVDARRLVGAARGHHLVGIARNDGLAVLQVLEVHHFGEPVLDRVPGLGEVLVGAELPLHLVEPVGDGAHQLRATLRVPDERIAGGLARLRRGWGAVHHRESGDAIVDDAAERLRTARNGVAVDVDASLHVLGRQAHAERA
jgi:hypothetical protein